MTKEKQEHVKVPNWVIMTFLLPTIAVIFVTGGVYYMSHDMAKDIDSIMTKMDVFAATVAVHTVEIANLKHHRYEDYR